MSTAAELLPTSRPRPNEHSPGGRSPKVLVVDANVRHCLLYQVEIEARGYQVVCAHNGRDALEQIQQSRFDVAVIDVRLPDVNGLDLAQKISHSHPHPEAPRVPIIVNTAYPYSKSHTRQWAIDAFILKSSNLDELLGKIALFSRFGRMKWRQFTRKLRHP